MTRVIADVPPEKLQQVVQDLEYEVGKENIHVDLQPNGRWRLEYNVGEASSPTASGTSQTSGTFFKR